MGIRLDKPWRPLDREQVEALKAQLGVYQLGDAEGTVLRIGAADARTTFGLRSALEEHLDRPEPTWFRFEVNQAYRTRYAELLMCHVADHGDVPPENDEDPAALGRLSPA